MTSTERNEEIWKLNSTHFLHYHDKEGRTTDGRGIFKPAFDRIMETLSRETAEVEAKSHREWRANKKGVLLETVKKLFKDRSGYRCDHCERQYDDDICNACFAKMLVEKFEESIK